MSNQVTPASYFDQLVGMSEDEAKQQQVALAKRQLKRKIASAYDDAERQRIERQQAVQSMFDGIRRNPTSGVVNFDVNIYIARTVEISALETNKQVLAEQYRRLFGEDMPELG